MRLRPLPKPLLLLVAGALIGVPPAAASGSEGGSEKGAEGKGAEGKGGESAHPSPLFVTLDPLDVPIVEGDRADGRLKLNLVLQGADDAAAAAIDTRRPALREAALAAAIEFARLHASPSTPVDARRLAADVTTALRRIDPTIRAVLVVEVAARRA